MAIPVSTASATGTTSVIVSKPGSNWVSGSLLIAVVSITGTSTLPSPPTGWTIVKQHSTAAAQANLSVYSLALTSAGAASYTFDATGATSATAGVLEYSASTASGVDTTAAPTANSAATSTAVSFTAITTTNASEVVCLALSLASGGQTASGWTSPYAEELHQAGTGGLATFYYADATQAAAGTTGTIGVTLSGSAAHWTAIEFALLPPAGISLTLSSLAATTAIGVPTAAETLALGGLASSSAIGSPTSADAVGLGGVAATSAIAAIAPKDVVALPGLTATAAIASLVPITSADPAWTSFANSDLTVRSAPTFPGKPAYLGSVTDPDYGTTIIRITGDPGSAISGISGGIWGYCARHHYSLDQAWNADESLIALVPNQDPNTPISVATSAATTSGNVLTFATSAIANTTVAVGYKVADTTTPGSIPAGRTVTAIGTNTVTISGAAVTVASGDTISFTDPGNPRDWLFLDGSTYAPLYAPTPPPGNQDARWHPTDPTKMIYVDGTDIGYYFPASGGTTTLVHTFTGYTGLTLGSFKGFPSRAANPIVPIMGTRTSDSATVVFSYDLSTGTKSVDIVPTTVSSASVSYSGSYIGIINTTDQTYVYNRETGALIQGPWGNGSLQEGEPSHADITIDQAGNDVYVGSDRTNGGIVIKRRLSDGTITNLTSATSANFSDHTSARSVAFPDWAFATYYGYTEGAGSYPLYLGEIIGVKLDAGHNPYRLGHHFSEDPTPNDYYAQVQASVSPLGTRIIFASNWGNPDGQSKRPIQAYIIDLRAPSVSPALSGLSATSAIATIASSDIFALPAVTASSAVGTVSSAEVERLSGVTAASSVGSVSDVAVEHLSGVSATSAVGALAVSEVGAISGLSASAAEGAPAVVDVSSLSGRSATTALGSLTIAESFKLSAEAATTAIGLLAPIDVKALPSQSAVTAIGSLAAADTIALGSLAATTGIGALGVETESSGQVTLSGLSAVTAVGSFGFVVSGGMSGLAATTVVGAPTPVEPQPLAGISASAFIAGPGSGDTVPAGGLAATVTIGAIYPSQQLTLPPAVTNIASLMLGERIDLGGLALTTAFTPPFRGRVLPGLQSFTAFAVPTVIIVQPIDFAWTCALPPMKLSAAISPEKLSVSLAPPQFSVPLSPG